MGLVAPDTGTQLEALVGESPKVVYTLRRLETSAQRGRVHVCPRGKGSLIKEVRFCQNENNDVRHHAAAQL